MTDQITVPSTTWDAMRGALERMLGLWDRTREAGALPIDYVRCKAALTAANAVQPQGEAWTDDQMISFAGMILLQRNHADSIEQRLNRWKLHHKPHGTASICAAPTKHGDQEFKKYLKDCAVCSIKPDIAGAFHAGFLAATHPQATESADHDSLMEKAYERGWIECACWANRDDLRADVGSPAYLADRAPHLDAVKNGWPLGCEKCIDPDGIPCFPQYGVGPHTCFYKIPGAKVGESQPLPKDQWPDNYREDPDCPGMGVYWCPHCGSGKPAPEAKQ